MKIGAKIIKKTNTNKLNYKIMEKIIKEFMSVHKCGQIETMYNFKAVIKLSRFGNYRIKTTATKFEGGDIKAITKSELYFKDKNEMIKEFQFHYELCKKSVFTKLTKIFK